MSAILVTLITALWLLVAACSTIPPEQAAREALMWEAASECKKRFLTILSIDRIDNFGQVWYTTQFGTSPETQEFIACYQQLVREKSQSRPLASGRVSQHAGARTKISVPITIVGGMNLVSVTVNVTQQATLVATLLLDTGAGHTILSPALIERSGISIPWGAPKRTVMVFGGNTISVPFTRIQSLKVGDLEVEDLDVGVHDGFPRVYGVDGVLGTNFLRHFRITLDHGSQELILEVIPPTGTTSASTAGSAALSWPAPTWMPGDEWRFRWESPTGKGTFVWTVTGEELIDNVAYYVVESGSRTLYYAKENIGWHMDKLRGVVVARASPSISYNWPLEVGKSWELTYEWEAPRARQTEQRYHKCVVAGEATVTVPAGTFATLHIVCKDRVGRAVHEGWYSPQVKHWVKEKALMTYGDRVRELVSHQVR